MNMLPSSRQGTHAGKGAATGDTHKDPYRYLGHTNGGPSAKFAFSEGSHGTVDAAATTDAAAATGGEAGLKPDLAGTAPYWASDLPNDMPQKQALLKGEDKLNDIPPELRKSFRQRMEDLVSGKAAERKNDAGPLRELADGIKAITSADSAHRSARAVSQSAAGAWHPRFDDAKGAPAVPSDSDTHRIDAEREDASKAVEEARAPLQGQALDTVSSKDSSEQQGLAAAAHDPLNANDRINRYMDHRMLNKEHSFKSFENTLHYDPNAF